MRERDDCLTSNSGCVLSDGHEFTLVNTILQAIQHYDQTAKIDPCPRCLRDAILTVAALLHIEAARLRSGSSVHRGEAGKCHEDSFAESARERLRAVEEVIPSVTFSRLRQ